MTFKARPVVKRTHRPSWETDNRRNLMFNIGFGLAVVAALLILAGAAAASWYGDHLASVASVNGSNITKDDLRERIAVDSFRIDHAKSLIRDELSAGRISQTDATTQTNSLDQSLQSVNSTALEELIDAELQRQLAGQQGVTVSDADINAKLTEEATSQEWRHVWVIAVTPEVSANAAAPTDAQKAAAQAKADGALKDLQSGKAWNDVVKAVSTDSSASSDGDLGWKSATDTSLDPAFHDALFAAPLNTPTAVVAGADGDYRIGRVTEIQAPALDNAYQQTISNTMSLDAYKKAVRADVTKDKLEAKFVADLTQKPTVQRQVSEIFIAASQGGTGDEVKAKHILFSPKHDPNGAKDIPATDPSWTQAHDEAQAAYEELKKDPSKWDALAAKSDDAGSAANGGELPYYTKDSLVAPFANAIFAPGLTKGEILAPVKSDFGWHVIMFVDRRPDPKTRATNAQNQASQPGADFAAIAKSVSEGPDASKGGDLGWVAHYQLPLQIENPIFLTPVGTVSSVVQTTDGFYVFKVVAEQTRLPDPDQVTALQKNAFTNWYNLQKANAKITRSGAVAPAAS